VPILQKSVMICERIDLVLLTFLYRLLKKQSQHVHGPYTHNCAKLVIERVFELETSNFYLHCLWGSRLAPNFYCTVMDFIYSGASFIGGFNGFLFVNSKFVLEVKQ